MDDQRRILLDGAIAVVGSDIVAVGTTEELIGRFSSSRVLDVAGGIVHPGFVDMHLHVSQLLGRGAMPRSWPVSREHEHWLPYVLNITEEEEFVSAQLAYVELISNGATCFVDLGGIHDGTNRAEAAISVGIRGVVSNMAWDQPPDPRVGTGSAVESVSRLEALVQQFPPGKDHRVWGGVGLPALGSCSDELLLLARELADRNGLPLFLHASFTEADVDECRRMAGGRAPILHFEDIGILGPATQLIHANIIEPAEVDAIVRTGASIVHCPGAALRAGLGTTAHKFPELLDRGVAVGLGSDDGNFSDAFDPSRQAYLASTLHSDADHGGVRIAAEQALEMLTIHPARALGLSDVIGSLEPQKRADIVVRSTTVTEAIPSHHPVHSLVFALGPKAIRTVMIDGEIVLDDGQPTRVDGAEIRHRASRAARDLHHRMGWRQPSLWPTV